MSKAIARALRLAVVLPLAAAALAGCGHAPAPRCEAGGRMFPAGTVLLVDGQGNGYTAGSDVPGGVRVTCVSGTWQSGGRA
jgi:hypothetical protein